MAKAREITWKVTDSGCHECTSHGTVNNYYPKKGKENMHRYVYRKHHGEIPEDMVVRHICDNIKCINVDHLELGTQADNQKDKIFRQGHKPFKRLDISDEDRAYIKACTDQTMIIANSFCISTRAVRHIRNGSK